jgi:hypothetical protein
MDSDLFLAATSLFVRDGVELPELPDKNDPLEVWIAKAAAFARVVIDSYSSVGLDQISYPLKNPSWIRVRVLAMGRKNR